VVCSIDLGIELYKLAIESGLTAFSIHTNVIKIMIPKWRTLGDELLLGRGIGLPVCHLLTATSQYHAHSKQVPNALIFGNISSACAKEYLIAATY